MGNCVLTTKLRPKSLLKDVILFQWFGLSLVCGAYGGDTPFPRWIQGVDLTKSISSQVDLGQSRKGTVVIFLSAKCPCSASHEPVLGKLHDEFKDSGFTFIGVHSNADESEEFAMRHFKDSAISFPVLHDPQSKWADTFAAYKTPHVFVLNPKMEILFQGGVDNSHQASRARAHYLRDALEAIREGKQPVEKNVRVLGCAIRRPS
jgi:hypothetical protein